MSQRNRFFIPREDKRLGERYQLLEHLGDGSYGWVWRAEKLDNHRDCRRQDPEGTGSEKRRLGRRGGSASTSQPTRTWSASTGWAECHRNASGTSIEMEYFPERHAGQSAGHRGARLRHQLCQDPWDSTSKWWLGSSICTNSECRTATSSPRTCWFPGDRAKITDFGSSILPEDMYTRTRENGGTILYSAPEIVGTTRRGRGREEIFRADIYSLGVLLYHLVTSATAPRHAEPSRQVCPVPSPARDQSLGVPGAGGSDPAVPGP